MFEHSQDHAYTGAAPTIRPYRESDERGWLRCSVLSFLDTAYFDSVFQRKPRYDHPSIELVADDDGAIVGVIDVECEEEPNTVCSSCAVENSGALGGMIWHLAVHPDYQRRGIGGLLLAEARRRAQERGVRCFEAYTRDDPATLGWYESHGFRWIQSYLHVYIEGRDEVDRAVQSSIPRLRPVQIFAHYTGDNREAVRARFRRVHDCNLYRLSF